MSTLLFMDTDSLCYQLITNNIYTDFQRHSEHFDFSNYKTDHPNYSITNMKVIGKMKDENGGVIMTEFVGLRAKCYSFINEAGIEVKKDKGIPKSVVQHSMQHEHWKSCLFDKSVVRANMNMISSQNHGVRSVSKTKIALNVFDDKRFILGDGIETVPHGHYRYK